MWGQLLEAREHHQRGRLVQLHWRYGLHRRVGGASLSRVLAFRQGLVEFYSPFFFQERQGGTGVNWTCDFGSYC